MQERKTFRYVVGILAILGGLGGLAGLYLVEVPAANENALMLALGIVLGWGGAVVQGEWGSSPTGRQMAQLGADLTAGRPISAKITNTEAEPVPTTDNNTDGKANG